jgi:ceramide glucosyltransferase
MPLSDLHLISTSMFFLWAAALLIAIWGLRIAQVMSKRWPRVARRPMSELMPRVAVILPIKGIEAQTRENVAALLKQNYPHYRLLFAVEHEADPVVPLLEEIALAHPEVPIEIVICGSAVDGGQKIHNQLAAVDWTNAQDEILAFMDADACPGADWLHALISPLTHGSHIGASTGYRFYVAETSHPANGVVAVINAGVAALFGPFRRTFAWGGSMAMRRPDFFAYRVHQLWRHALSDDFVLSHCVRKIGRAKIAFVPQCLVASHAHFDWSSLFEFAVRQYRITRICASMAWVAGTGGAALYIAALIYAISMCVRAITLQRYNWYHFLLMAISLYLFSIIRGLFLLTAAKRMLPDHWPKIRRTWFFFTVGFPIVQAFNLLALLTSAFGRRIQWRGIGYTMRSRTATVVHRPPSDATLPTPA